MKNYFKILLIAVVVLISFQSIHGQKTNIEGWGKVKWGMTKDQVKSIYQNEVIDSVKFLMMKGISIVDDKFDVKFFFEKNSLYKIQLCSPTFDKTVTSRILFKKLEEILYTNYGKPEIIQNDVVQLRNEFSLVTFSDRTWLLPKTKIVLVLREMIFEVKIIDIKQIMNSCEIIYEKATQSNDVL